MAVVTVKNKYEWGDGSTRPHPFALGKVIIGVGRTAVCDKKDVDALKETDAGKWYLKNALEVEAMSKANKEG